MSGPLRTASVPLVCALLLGGCAHRTDPDPMHSLMERLESPASLPSEMPFQPGEFQTAPDPRKLLSREVRKELRLDENLDSACNEQKPNDPPTQWTCNLVPLNPRPSDDGITIVSLELHRPSYTEGATEAAQKAFDDLPHSPLGSTSWVEASLGDEALRSPETETASEGATVAFRFRNILVRVKAAMAKADGDNVAAHADEQRQRAWRVASDLADSLSELRQ